MKNEFKKKKRGYPLRISIYTEDRKSSEMQSWNGFFLDNNLVFWKMGLATAHFYLHNNTWKLQICDHKTDFFRNEKRVFFVKNGVPSKGYLLRI